MNLSLELLAIIIGIMGSILAWLLSDSRSKSRVMFLDEKLDKLRLNHEDLDGFTRTHVSDIEIAAAKSAQERSEIFRSIERLEHSKASREIVEGIRQEISLFKVDMDKRFDRLEKLILRQDSFQNE